MISLAERVFGLDLKQPDPFAGWADDWAYAAHQIDMSALAEAENTFRRGEIAEALIWLERALAPELHGFHDLADKITRYFGSRP